MLARRLARIALVVISLAGPLAVADAQTVVNGSFQANVLADGQFLAGANQTTGWLVAGSAGTLDPNTNAFANGVIPDGDQVGFVGTGGSLTQTFAEVLAANTTYTVSYYVGDRGDMSFPGYLVSLRAGGTTLASDGSLTPANGQFAFGSFSFSTGASHALLGQALSLRLAAGSGAGQAAFDLASLSANGGGVSTFQSHSTPEPTTVALLAAGMLVVGGVTARRKRAQR